MRVSLGVGRRVFYGSLHDGARLLRAVEHILRERPERVRDAETDGVHRGEVFDRLRNCRLICSVTRVRVGLRMAGRLGEVDQTRPHQPMEIRDPERMCSA